MKSYTSKSFNYALECLECEIRKSFNRRQSCDFYIAILDNANHSEVYANERKIFSGNDIACKKMFKQILKLLKNNNDKICLSGNFKDVLYIKKKI